MRGPLDAAAGVEQYLFLGDLNVHAKILMHTQVIGNHICEVMCVDDDFANPEVAEPHKSQFKHCSATDFNQSLGTIVSERTKSRAQAGSQDHRLHFAIFSGKFFSSSMWRTTTSTPL